MHIFILTGAGISAESGLDTYRNSGPDSLWSRYDLFELATPEAFAQRPDEVMAFTNLLRRNILNAKPNPAHMALATFGERLRKKGGRLTLVTQNVDDLHERAGSIDVLHMHGEILKARCRNCAAVSPFTADLQISNCCESCGYDGALRPHLVWFGEEPLFMDVISESMKCADLFVAIGTSGTVYPAAGFVAEAKSLGIRTCEINLEPTSSDTHFDERYLGPASKIVPEWCERQLHEIKILNDY